MVMTDSNLTAEEYRRSGSEDQRYAIPALISKSDVRCGVCGSAVQAHIGTHSAIGPIAKGIFS